VADDWEIHHAVQACCPCGFTTALVRCGCAVSRSEAWEEHKKEPHEALDGARAAIQPHLDQTGHTFPVLEHRFVLVRADGTTQDFRAYPEAVEAAEPAATAV